MAKEKPPINKRQTAKVIVIVLVVIIIGYFIYAFATHSWIFSVTP